MVLFHVNFMKELLKKNGAKRHMQPLHINFGGIEKGLVGRGGEEKYFSCNLSYNVLCNVSCNVLCSVSCNVLCNASYNASYNVS